MSEAHALGYETGTASRKKRFFRWVFVKGLLPSQARLRFAVGLLRLYQRSGLQGFLRKVGFFRLLPARLRELDAQAPALPARFFGPSPRVYRAQGETRTRVALLSGCIMPLVEAPVMEATIRVLNRNGCDVVVPEGQGCCGAISEHDGNFEAARKMARRNIDVFLAANVDAVVTNSAGCGLAMKEYGELLHDDPEYADKAQRFSALVRDITEFLVQLPWQEGLGPVPERVTLQDSCHVVHAQRITDAPRAILRSIPGLELVEMEGSDRCCGSAGIYNLSEQEMSRQLLEGKMRDIEATGAQVVASTNPGCMLQIEVGLRRSGADGRAVHVVELLDEAYAAGDHARARSEENA